MNYGKLASLALVAVGLATLVAAENQVPTPVANPARKDMATPTARPVVAKGEVVAKQVINFYATPVPKVIGKLIKVDFSITDKNKKPCAKKIVGELKIIFKQGDKVVHAGKMKPG